MEPQSGPGQNFLFSPGPLSLADMPTIHTVVFSYSLLLIEGTKERHTTNNNGEECGPMSKLKKLGKAERQICKSFP